MRNAPPSPFSEAAFTDSVRRFAASLGCRPPAVRFSPPAEIRDPFDAVVLDQYRRGFFAFHVRKDGESLIFVDPRPASLLSAGALAALAAHETSHAADYLMAWRQSLLGRILPGALHSRIEAWAEPSHETFANRAAAALVGGDNLHRLHVEASGLMGHPAGDVVAPAIAPGLPASLRLSIALAPMKKRTGGERRSVSRDASPGGLRPSREKPFRRTRPGAAAVPPDDGQPGPEGPTTSPGRPP